MIIHFRITFKKYNIQHFDSFYIQYIYNKRQMTQFRKTITESIVLIPDTSKLELHDTMDTTKFH